MPQNDPWAVVSTEPADPWAVTSVAPVGGTDTGAHVGPDTRSLYQKAKDRFMQMTAPNDAANRIPAAELAKGAVRGAAMVARHPLNAIGDSARMVFDVGNQPILPWIAPPQGSSMEQSRQRIEDFANQSAESFKENPEYFVGEQLGPMALGEAAGAVLPKITPRVLKDAVNDRAQALGQKVIVGSKPVRELVENTKNANQAEMDRAAQNAIETDQKNAEITRKNLKKQGKYDAFVKDKAADYANRVADYEAKVQDINAKHEADTAAMKAEHARQVAEHQNAVKGAVDTERVRQETFDEHQRLSAEQAAAYEAAQTAAKNANDANWATYRKEVGNVEGDPTPVVDTINAQKNTTLSDPEDVAEFRQVLKDTSPSAGEATDIQSTRDAIAKNQGAKSYASASPKLQKTVDDLVSRLGLDADEAPAIKATTAPQVGIWKTQLEYAIRKAKRGNVRYALGQVLDQVRDLQSNMAAQAGPKATEALNAARATHGAFVDTFRNSPNEVETAADRSLRRQTPDFVQSKKDADLLQRVAQYDPSVVDRANRIQSLQRTLDTLPSQTQTAAIAAKPAPTPPVFPERPTLPPRPELPPLKDAPEPKPLVTPKPAEIQTVGPNEIRQAKLKHLNNRINWVRHRGEWIATGSGFFGVVTSLVEGKMSHAAEAVVFTGATLGATEAIASFVTKPGVEAWLTNPLPRDIEYLNRLPEEQRAAVGEAMRPTVRTAEKQGIRVAPALLAITGLIGAPRTPAEAKKQIKDAQK